jgi:hypothetical protein
MTSPVHLGTMLTQALDPWAVPPAPGTARPGRVARPARVASAATAAGADATITIRRASPGAAEVRDLAELDSVPAPAGAVLVAEVGGEPVAAIPLDGGPAFANPFRPTAKVVALLEARAAQVRGVTAPAWGRRPRRRLRARLGGVAAA